MAFLFSEKQMLKMQYSHTPSFLETDLHKLVKKILSND